MKTGRRRENAQMPRIFCNFCASDYTSLFLLLQVNNKGSPLPEHTLILDLVHKDQSVAYSINCWHWRPVRGVQYQLMTLKTRLQRTVSSADSGDQSVAYSINCWHWRPVRGVQYQLLTLKTSPWRTVSTADAEDQSLAYIIKCWHWRPVRDVQYQVLTRRPGYSVQYQVLTPKTRLQRTVPSADTEDQAAAYSINCWHWRPVPGVQYQLLTLKTSSWGPGSTTEDQSVVYSNIKCCTRA